LDRESGPALPGINASARDVEPTQHALMLAGNRGRDTGVPPVPTIRHGRDARVTPT